MLSNTRTNQYLPPRGFTLIEILVALTIIVLMGGIVLAAFTASRDRADDGDLKQQLGLMRFAAEESYKNNRNTLGVCSDVSTLINGLPSGVTFTCADGPGGYAFEVVLSTGEYYCVDFMGRERTNSGPAIVGSCSSGTDCDCR